jgi:propanol-preferring alcohol dehydrogenase
VEREVPDPGPGQVRIRVEACTICHTDAATVMGVFPGLTLPLVPGHEVIGRMMRWRWCSALQNRPAGRCRTYCRRRRSMQILQARRCGELRNPVMSGVTIDGGYAEGMIADARGPASVPDELTSVGAAPLYVLCHDLLRNATQCCRRC